MPSAIKRFYGKLTQAKHSFEFPYSPYNKRHNCIFIHIPKVAGTSITEALGDRRAKRNHLPWYVYYTANRNFFENSYKFAFVRNPWDRAVSAYNYLVAGGNKVGDLNVSEQISNFESFDDFIINGIGEGSYRNHLLFIPQSEFVVNGEQELVVDFLGRFESLENDFRNVLGSLGLRRELSNVNSSKRASDYKEYYKDERSIEVVREVYAQDVKMFSYEF
ncbi:sulfotransferase family 2 domain-containing protein [Marinobacter bohaiensis]|uniref:sulfotransferase family 2 domain-containing protein n=1 Tax=Marinobacter bohaiensis TaxID=2201898 RepID=UPI000DAC882F|nr:sulfotransferase family 2 domain-containing protein [Marinobacter bohaiensis]